MFGDVHRRRARGADARDHRGTASAGQGNGGFISMLNSPRNTARGHVPDQSASAIAQGLRPSRRNLALLTGPTGSTGKTPANLTVFGQSTSTALTAQVKALIVGLAGPSASQTP